MRSLQHFDAKLEIKSMAGNLYPLVLMIMVNIVVYIMITLANDDDGDEGDEGDDGADDDCRNHSSSHCRKPRWLPLDEIGDKDKLGRPIKLTRITMITFFA